MNQWLIENKCSNNAGIKSSKLEDDCATKLFYAKHDQNVSFLIFSNEIRRFTSPILLQAKSSIPLVELPFLRMGENNLGYSWKSACPEPKWNPAYENSPTNREEITTNFLTTSLPSRGKEKPGEIWKRSNRSGSVSKVGRNDREQEERKCPRGVFFFPPLSFSDL